MRCCMKQAVLQADPINEQEMNAAVTPRDYLKGPIRANMDLLRGPRKDYLRIGVPLYEAAIKCDWKAAEDIFEKNKELELVRYSITENGETALHIAASAKVPGKVNDFVKNLVSLMTEDDLALENANYNTALYLAAAAGNINTVKIMLDTYPKLLEILGGGSSGPPPNPPTMMPIYVAALFGNHNVVNYMYEKSNDLNNDPWTPQTRCWLLEKCVENNMFVYHPNKKTALICFLIYSLYFATCHKNQIVRRIIMHTVLIILKLYPLVNVKDKNKNLYAFSFLLFLADFCTTLSSQRDFKSVSDVALKIVTKYPKLETGSVLTVLARKPEAFREPESNFIQRTISWGINLYSKKNVTHQPSQNGDGSASGDLIQEHPSQNGNGSVPGDLNQEAAITCSAIGRTIKAGKHLYSSSIIGKAITSGKHRCSSSIIVRAIKSGKHLHSFMFSFASTIYQFLRFKPGNTRVHVSADCARTLGFPWLDGKDPVTHPDANMAFDLRPTENVLPWPGNVNMAFDLRPTEDVLPWPGGANIAFDLVPDLQCLLRTWCKYGIRFSIGLATPLTYILYPEILMWHARR
ncbi:ankyrin repeat-containing domain, PGG domain protein [Tanacetum coccineum]|uniref:Ankyrin repeat-containing domain, PGG domain protein n=1 Tax=Tanacetum coccineum TaxID=301880 RepID=A0ABQ5BIJ1_9ASTR